MKFWSGKVKSGQVLDVKLFDQKLGVADYLQLTQATVVETGPTQGPVTLYLHVNGKKNVIATLDPKSQSNEIFDMVFVENIQFSHNLKNGFVNFFGTKGQQSPKPKKEEGSSS